MEEFADNCSFAKLTLWITFEKGFSYNDESDSLKPYTEKEFRKTSIFSVSDVDGSDIEGQKIIKRGKYAAWGLFMDYSSNSTIHGVKYLGENKRHWSERAFWLIAFIIAVCGCADLIVKIYIKWQQTPVIVSFAEKSTPIWSVPFPAVTICPEIKAKRKFLNISEGYLATIGEPPYGLSDEILDRLAVIAQVCDPHLFVARNLTTDNTESLNCVEYIREMAVPFEEMILFCKWTNIIEFCTNLFTEILTEEGFCYTFNMLDSSEIYAPIVHHDLQINVTHNFTKIDWSLEKGYPNAEIETYPRRVLGSGARGGFNIVLGLFETDLEYLCRGPVQGFKILLHTPGEIPRVSKHYFRVPLNQEVLVAVKPQMITTSENLVQYPFDRRQCYFNNEKHLKYFKLYTQSNCELECLANFTRQECGCVKFSMPRNDGDRICGQLDVECYNTAEDNLYKKELVESLKSTSAQNKRGVTNCHCLPSCTSITYDAEISQADYDWPALFRAYNSSTDEVTGYQMARLTIFFKENQFITSKRSELYGVTDFMANVGGLLGLFMGVSILSIIEIIYYLTLRLTCNLNLRRIYRNKLRRLSSVQPNKDPVPGITINNYANEKND